MTDRVRQMDCGPLLAESVAAAIDDLRGDRVVSDRGFDQIFPASLRHLSSRFWTPAVVGRKACRLLAETGGPVLDVGAGAGKVCIVGALVTDVPFFGIEQREALVETANQVIESLGLQSRARVARGLLQDVDWKAYRAFYFHNPFNENVFPAERRFDETVALTKERQREDSAYVEAILDELPRGARIVTFHGLGGRVPATYRLHPEMTRGTAFLKCYIKEEDGSANGEGILDE